MKIPKMKPIKAWAVMDEEGLFMGAENESKFWARIMRTKRQAKELYPKKVPIRIKIVPIEIKILNSPEKKLNT